MQWLRIIAITILAAVLQASLFGALRISGVVANLVLVVVVAASVWLPASKALAAAVVGGLCMDFLGGGSFGLATSSLVLIAVVLIGLRQAGVDGDAWPLRIALVVTASVLWWIIHLAALGALSSIGWVAFKVLLIEIMYNSVLLVLVPERVIRGARPL